jgi:opacity protein-like surface antigen
MPLPSSRLVLFAACALAAAAPPATAQTRDRWREEDERRARREREARDREIREEREYRAREAARRAAETRARLARERAERDREARERAARAAAERRRRDDWGDSYRPRITLGGGIDVRDFGGEGDRYVVQGGVDFRSRSGFGMRPEVLFAWSEPASTSDILSCPACSSLTPVALSQVGSSRGRSRMIGIAVNGTYTLARSSPVRPYLLSGLGVFSTRSPQPTVLTFTPGGAVNTQSEVRFRNDVDVGLTAGAGLEFDVGPVRLFTEFRYLLTDQQRPRGFSGMLPLTAGLRL